MFAMNALSSKANPDAHNLLSRAHSWKLSSGKAVWSNESALIQFHTLGKIQKRPSFHMLIIRCCLNNHQIKIFEPLGQLLEHRKDLCLLSQRPQSPLKAGVLSWIYWTSSSGPILYRTFMLCYSNAVDIKANKEQTNWRYIKTSYIQNRNLF